jgi:hypothetical protein
MTDSIHVLDQPTAASTGSRPRRLRSRKAVAAALASAGRREVWVLRSHARFSDLVRAISQVTPEVTRAWLVSYVRPDPAVARMVASRFERVLLSAPAMVPPDELEEILSAPRRSDYCVGAEWSEGTDTLALWRGDLSVLVVPMSDFPARAGTAPDPSDLAVEDCGQTIRMGEYEASFDAILFDRDPAYRRHARKRMIASAQGLGASIRRLRLRSGVARSDFPGLDEKTLARIEREEVAKPHAKTLRTIARRLGVGVDELAAH